VIDETGLEGLWDYQVTYSDMGNGQAQVAPGLLTAIHDQLGLKLEKKRAMVSVLAVRSVHDLLPD
jgi:uncharacterized protein (TIGR03435 family)